MQVKTGKEPELLKKIRKLNEENHEIQAYFPRRVLYIKVDRRKQRAKVLLDMYTDSFPIDLAFDVIEPAAADSYRLEGRDDSAK